MLTIRTLTGRSKTSPQTIAGVEQSDRRLKIREMATQLDFQKTIALVEYWLFWKNFGLKGELEKCEIATWQCNWTSRGKNQVWQEKHKWEVLQHHIQYTHAVYTALILHNQTFFGTIHCKNICEERILNMRRRSWTQLPSISKKNALHISETVYSSYYNIGTNALM